jgi:hypothetical protein
MGSNDITTKEDMQALSQQSEAVQRAAAALSAATARARGVRLCLVVATVLLIAVICVKFYGLGMAVQSPEYLDGVTTLGQKRLAERSDKYAQEFQKLVDHASPALTKAFSEQIKKDMPEFVKQAEKEKDTLVSDMQKEFTNKVNAHYEQLVKQQEETLKKELPTIKDPAAQERMVKNINKAVEKLVKKFYVDDFRRQLDELIYSWDHFPEAPAPKPGEPSLMDQFIPTGLHFLAIRLYTSGFRSEMLTASSSKTATSSK